MFEFLFFPNGRVSRSDRWFKFFLPCLGITIVAAIIDFTPLMPPGLGGKNGLAQTTVSIFYFWPNIAVSIKRFHDRNMSGWWTLYSVLLAVPGTALILYGAFVGQVQLSSGQLSGPVAGFIFGGVALIFVDIVAFFIIQFCLPGTHGPNKYGEDPLTRLSAVTA